MNYLYIYIFTRNFLAKPRIWLRHVVFIMSVSHLSPTSEDLVELKGKDFIWMKEKYMLWIELPQSLEYKSKQICVSHIIKFLFQTTLKNIYWDQPTYITSRFYYTSGLKGKELPCLPLCVCLSIRLYVCRINNVCRIFLYLNRTI